MTRTGGAMGTGFGGFPNPVKVVANAASRRILSTGGAGSTELGRTTTLQSIHSNSGLSDFAAGPTRAVSYISFDATVGRNSRFYNLTSAQKEELGGIEYRVRSLACIRVFRLTRSTGFVPAAENRRGILRACAAHSHDHPESNLSRQPIQLALS